MIAREKHIQLIEHYRDIYNYTKMISTCLEALSHYPLDDELQALLALAYYNYGLRNNGENIDKALELCKNIGAGSRHFEEALWIEAQIYYDRNDYTNAIPALEKLLVYNKSSYFAKYAIVQQKINQTEKAKAAIEKALELNPGDLHTIWLSLELAELCNESLETKFKIIARFVEAGGSLVNTNIMLGNLYVDHGRMEDAREYFIKALMLAPSDMPIRRKLEYIESEIVFNSPMQSGLRDMYTRANNYTTLECYDKSLEICKEMLTKCRYMPILNLAASVYNLLGMNHKVKEVVDEMRQNYGVVGIGLDTMYAKTLLHLGEHDECKNLLDSIPILDASNNNAFNADVVWVNQLYKSRFCKSPEEELAVLGWIKLDSRIPSQYVPLMESYLSAKIYEKYGDYHKAAEKYEAVIRLTNQRTDTENMVEYALINAYMQIGQYQGYLRCVRLLQDLLASKKHRFKALLFVIKVHHAMGNYDIANKYYAMYIAEEYDREYLYHIATKAAAERKKA